jgi:hypothetical protein
MRMARRMARRRVRDSRVSDSSTGGRLSVTAGVGVAPLAIASDSRPDQRRMANLCRTAGVQPALGRWYTGAED